MQLPSQAFILERVGKRRDGNHKLAASPHLRLADIHHSDGTRRRRVFQPARDHTFNGQRATIFTLELGDTNQLGRDPISTWLLQHLLDEELIFNDDSTTYQPW